VLLAGAREVSDRRQRLDRLAESHLVPDDHLPLTDDEPGREVLVLAEAREGEQIRVQLDALDQADQTFREVAVGVLGDAVLVAELREQGEIVALAGGKIIGRADGQTRAVFGGEVKARPPGRLSPGERA